MVANKIHIEDITQIGRFGTLTVTLPNQAAVASTKNLVSYVKKAYPREDGLTYFCRIDGNTIVVGTVRPDTITRKMTLEEIKKVAA